jgi:hypothetical protein
MPVGDWTDAPAGLSGLVRFAPKRNLVSAREPSHFKRSLPRFRKNLLPPSTLKIWAETFYETLVSIYRTTRYQPTVMSIAVTFHKIYHNVQLFAPAILVDLVKWLQFLTPKAGGNEPACNTSDARHLVLLLLALQTQLHTPVIVTYEQKHLEWPNTGQMCSLQVTEQHMTINVSPSISTSFTRSNETPSWN